MPAYFCTIASINYGYKLAAEQTDSNYFCLLDDTEEPQDKQSRNAPIISHFRARAQFNQSQLIKREAVINYAGAACKRPDVRRSAGV